MEALLDRMLRADTTLAAWQKQVDREWQRLRDEDERSTGNNLGFLRRLAELSQEARARAGPNPSESVHLHLDEVADVFLACTEGERATLAEYFEVCPALRRIHLEYLARATVRVRETGDPLWMRRGLALVVLGRGGDDFRDLHVSLDHLKVVAAEMGVDASRVLREVASLTPGLQGSGGVRGTIQEFVRRFAPESA